jgi:hypothetical protein
VSSAPLRQTKTEFSSPKHSCTDTAICAGLRSSNKTMWHVKQHNYIMHILHGSVKQAQKLILHSWIDFAFLERTSTQC